MYLDSLLLVLIIILVTLSIFIYIGYGPGRLLISKKLQNYFWYIIPFIGISILVAVGEVIGFLGLGVKTTLIILIVFSTIFNLLATWFVNKKVYVFNKHFAITVIIFVVLASFPLFYNNKLITIGSNGDAISYVSVSDYLSYNGTVLPNDTNSHPFDTLVLNVLSSGTRLGPMYIQGLVDTVLNMKGYQTLTAISNVFFGLILISSWIFGRYILRLKKAFALCVPMFMGLNNLILWIGYDCSFSQIMATAFIPLILMYLFRVLDGDYEVKDIALTGIFTAGLMSIYPESFIYILGILGVYFILSLFQKKYNVFSIIKRFGIITAITIMFNPIAFYRFIDFVQQKLSSTEFATEAARRTAGNIRYFLPLSEVFGITPHNAIEPYHLPIFVKLCVLVLMLFIILVITIKVIRSNKFERIVIISLLSPFLLIALFNYYLAFPYGYSKTLSFGSIFVILVFLKSVQDLYLKIRVFRPILLVGTLTLLMVNALSYCIVVARTAASVSALETKFIELERVSNFVGRDKVLRVDSFPPSAGQMWVNYFLKEPQLEIPKVIAYYGPENIFANKTTPEFLLDDAKSTGQQKDYSWLQTPVFETENYKVIPKRPGLLLKQSLNDDGDFVQLQPGSEIYMKINNKYLEYTADTIVKTTDLKSIYISTNSIRLEAYAVQDVKVLVEVTIMGKGNISKHKTFLNSESGLNINLPNEPINIRIRNIDQRPLFMNSIYFFQN